MKKVFWQDKRLICGGDSAGKRRNYGRFNMEDYDSFTVDIFVLAMPLFDVAASPLPKHHSTGKREMNLGLYILTVLCR